MEAINKAKDSSAPYVVVIEEINRGNPAQIFGEMLTLLESDKRNADEGLELSYRKSDDERVYIPENLYVIGTMNIADRSLALVDLALRRRFAFIDLKPNINSAWKSWLVDKIKIPSNIVNEIQQRMISLNDQISKDQSLGSQYQIGHSYVTPTSPIADSKEWFKQVVQTEIYPLLNEYWFDNPDNAIKIRDQLLQDF
jgi:5-methylcytosine-specific restriction protein B